MYMDLMITFGVALALLYGIVGLLGGLFLAEGVRGALLSARSFLFGGAAAGALVVIVLLVAFPLAPAMAILYPVIAAGVGGYLLGKSLEE